LFWSGAPILGLTLPQSSNCTALGLSGYRGPEEELGVHVVYKCGAPLRISVSVASLHSVPVIWVSQSRFSPLSSLQQEAVSIVHNGQQEEDADIIAVLFGYDSGIITSTIALPTFREYFNDPSDTITGGIVSAFQGGAIAGTIFNMIFADMLGRRWTIMVGALISVLGSSLQAGATNMAMLIVGRFIGGIAVGQLTSTIPMYAGELSEAKHRGILSGLLQWMLGWGFFVAQWLGYGCSFNSTQFSWRFPLAFQNVPSLILIAGILFLQESPRWLMERDRHEDAMASLKKLRASINDETIELEFREIRDVILADRALGNIGWTSILTKPTWRKRLLLGCGVQAFGPLSGINVINYYGPRIYNILGISTRESLLIIGIQGGLSIVWCTIALALLDRVGRVKPLIVSAAGLGAALLVNAVQAQHLNPSNGAQLRSMVAMNFVFSFFYTPLGIISWVCDLCMKPRTIH
jgi:sugar porter (SP) family MFS transporter